MQRLIIDVDDKHIKLVVDLLSNLKQNIITNVIIQKKQNNNMSKLDMFHKLKDKSNNKTKLTMQIATNTDEMINVNIER